MTLKDKAIKLAWLINDEGHEPSGALAMLGFDEDDYFSEDSSCIDIDDPENELIDLSWEGNVHYSLKRTFVRHTDRGPLYVWEVHEMRQLTNHAGDPDFGKLTTTEEVT